MSRSGRGKEKSEVPMKVVFINTQYVETDARSFKTVVQELTGKDAIVAAGPYDSVSPSSATVSASGSARGRGRDCDRDRDHVEDTKRLYGGGGGGTTTEFMEELYKLWSEN